MDKSIRNFDVDVLKLRSADNNGYQASFRLEGQYYEKAYAMSVPTIIGISAGSVVFVAMSISVYCIHKRKKQFREQLEKDLKSDKVCSTTVPSESAKDILT